MNIKTQQRPSDNNHYMAYLDGHKEIWGCGATSHEAIRDLLSAHKDTFGDMTEDEILESHEIPDESSNETETPIDYIKRKRREFLEETVAHFSVNPLAANDMGDCVYSHKFNGGCAIGRELPADLAEEFDYMGIKAGMNLTVSNAQIFGLLPLKLSMLGDTFLQECQYLHDNDNNWDEKGLSPQGKKHFDIIIEWHC